MKLETIFGKLWESYSSQPPAVQQVHNLFINQGERVVNDHIAFRTFNDPRTCIDVLARPFLANGYVEKGIYEFARRYPDEKGNIYSGFIAKSADKIFESTNFYKK